MTITLNESFYRRKQAQLRAALEGENLDGILLLDAHNVTYGCGFFHIPSERPIGLYIPKQGSITLFAPLLEQENAATAHVDDIRTYFEYPGETHPVAWMVAQTGARRLGIDSIDQRVFAALDGVVMSSLVEQMRWIKDAEELDLIRRAAHYADFCLEQVRDYAAAIIRDGGTELDILRMCLSATSARIRDEVGEIFRLGGGAVVGTVHSGPRAALPHGSPGQRQPQPGDTLIAGIGVAVGGYHAESGATFVVGEPTGDTMDCLRAAAACDAAGIHALRVGATCASVNEAALAVLRDAGLGDAIRHRIGHGMGLQGHESPWLAPGDDTLLTVGMVFSNEPGIYRPGRDGYRTIDTMIVTDGAAEVPSRFLADNPPERRVLTV
jgi:Xaa-Pro dipeptidase